MFSSSVEIFSLSTKMAILDGRDEIYHSIWTFAPRTDVAGILLSNLLNLELKSYIFSPDLDFRFDKSLMSVTVVLSSPNLAINCSLNILQLVIEWWGSEKYQDPSYHMRVYGNNLTT